MSTCLLAIRDAQRFLQPAIVRKPRMMGLAGTVAHYFERCLLCVDTESLGRVLVYSVNRGIHLHMYHTRIILLQAQF